MPFSRESWRAEGRHGDPRERVENWDGPAEIPTWRWFLAWNRRFRILHSYHGRDRLRAPREDKPCRIEARQPQGYRPPIRRLRGAWATDPAARLCGCSRYW